MNSSNYKRIHDPIHGSIWLSELETEILNSRVFNRLRNIKQLGLAHFVFPGANYSRLSHSIGVCHVTGLLLDNLLSFSKVLPTKKKERDAEIVKLRLAGLLHDIGHYPFSHLMEESIHRHHISLQEKDGEFDTVEDIGDLFYRHEKLSEKLLTEDSELVSIMKNYDQDATEITSLIQGDGTSLLSNLISAEIDADRMDYLVRTSHHTGLPYGRVDLQYMLSQIRVDKKNNICFSHKATKVIDHFLLCRFFDYQQVALQKTTMAFEIVLRDVIEFMLKKGELKCSKNDIDSKIENDEWSLFDDHHVLSELKRVYDESEDEIFKLQAGSILYRKPAKLVYAREKYEKISDTDYYKTLASFIKDKRSSWETKFDIHEKLWYVETNASRRFTKLENTVSITSVLEMNKDDDDLRQEARILNRDEIESIPIVGVEDSLFSSLADTMFKSLRIYVLLNDDNIDKRDDIANTIAKDLG